jgi:hypothetical protein
MSEKIVPNYDDLIITAIDREDAAQVNRSAWTGKRKVMGLPSGELWYANAVVADLATELDERPWRAFMRSLRGQQNWFKLRVACQRHVGAMPLVAAGAGAGYTMPLKGMLPSSTILRAGQYLTVTLPQGNGRLIQLDEDLISDASGNATATFTPALNQTPVENAICETANPYLPVAQTASRNGMSTANAVSGVSFDLEEAF